jgi:hypothetical protein
MVAPQAAMPINTSILYNIYIIYIYLSIYLLSILSPRKCINSYTEVCMIYKESQRYRLEENKCIFMTASLLLGVEFKMSAQRTVVGSECWVPHHSLPPQAVTCVRVCASSLHVVTPVVNCAALQVHPWRLASQCTS